MAFSPQETFQHALTAMQKGKADNAARLFKQVLQSQPRHVGALNLLCLLLTRLGRYEEAEIYARRALHESASSDATFYNYGIILKALKRPVEALEQFSQALKINPSVAETWNNRGTVFSDLQRYREAIADFDRAIGLNPNYSDAFCNKANALTELKSYEQSLPVYDRALALKPDQAEAWVGRGKALAGLRQSEAALAAYERALVLKPDFAEAWVGRGHVLVSRKQYDDAVGAYDHAIGLKPDLAEAWLGRGNIDTERKQYDSALAAYARALSAKPDLAPAWLGRGRVLAELKRLDEALAASDRALALDPDSADAWVDRGHICTWLTLHEEAYVAYDKAFKIRPGLPELEGRRLHSKQCVCDWNNLANETSHLLAALRSGEPAAPPFMLLALPSSALDQLQCAQNPAIARPSLPPLWSGQIYSHDRIRLAYLSSDFREHPIAYLTAGLFEEHDRSRFEVTAISYAPEGPTTDLHDRIKGAFERFVDVRERADAEVAELIRQFEIDIAIDLNGITGNSRPNILARRPAPVQVNYLGYAGTMGADYIDYIVADATVIPRDQFVFFSEKVVWLPDSFMVNDSRRRVAERTPLRSECGLPEQAFVFCCFNNAYKLAPDIFKIWMRLLKATPNSVLWLSSHGTVASANLRRQAQANGVAPDRLIFAAKTPSVADHLARLRQADLFLDTLPYNAHTTAADALWVGVPVLTCPGQTFAGRVAASLNRAVGLPELVASSLEAYETSARALARDPDRISALKAKLARQRDTHPLFDTKRITRNIEKAYATMWERYRRGEPPQSFAVDSTAASAHPVN
jgi:protein O-GlcNAc transferase